MVAVENNKDGTERIVVVVSSQGVSIQGLRMNHGDEYD